MQFLESLFRTLNNRRKQKSLPGIALKASANYYKAFTAPNPDYNAIIYNTMGDQVGTATYALSPLSDRIYLFDIEIFPEHRRRGYATAVLLHLTQTYGQPITAVKELYSAIGFWNAARQMKTAGLFVTMPLSVSEMDVEAARWEHLRPVAKLLESQITERLTVHREPWNVAVGRGLETTEQTQGS